MPDPAHRESSLVRLPGWHVGAGWRRDLRDGRLAGLDAGKLGRHRRAIVHADISGDPALLDGRCVARQADAFAGGRIPDAYALTASLPDGIATGIDPPTPGRRRFMESSSKRPLLLHALSRC